MNMSPTRQTRGPHLEHTPADPLEGPTSIRSQSNLVQLREAAHIPTPIEDPSNTLNVDSLKEMPTISRFFHLLQQSKALVEAHGPHTTFSGTTVFSRVPLARNHSKGASVKDFAFSLAAAQDSIGSAQIDGPAKDDLAVFKYLWDTIVEVLESLISTGDLHHEALGWGIFGLSAGYIGHSSWQDDSAFLAHKTRLHDALMQMPSMETPTHDKKRSRSSRGQVGVLTKANREIHVCAYLLLQRFRREEWKRIRWFHGVAVAEKWIRNLGLEPVILPE